MLAGLVLPVIEEELMAAFKEITACLLLGYCCTACLK